MEKDLTGKKFERLTVIKEDDDRKDHWICKCDCGNTVSVLDYYLIHGKTKSCGCYKADMAKKNIEKIRDITNQANKELSIDGTRISALKQKVRPNSKTGYKGVSITKNGKYIAYIKLRGKREHLGTYEDIEKAIIARKAAEKMYYQPIIDKYEKMKENK
ncbi:MAG: hypothetical protein E7L43_02565 [Finegoldia magna]|nr:hypothetical protein [Finegoldia magna]